jgi:NAD(P)-dependent dehydrogenase (short-subunit alcohol dehydrogenase family)
VSVIAPGIIDTPQLQVDADDAGVTLEEMHAIYARNIPAGRIGAPDDIAKTVVFLATESARAYVGQTLHPNGGEVRC